MSGTGSNQPKGILKTTSISSISTAATTGWTYDDVVALLVHYLPLMQRTPFLL